MRERHRDRDRERQRQGDTERDTESLGAAPMLTVHTGVKLGAKACGSSSVTSPIPTN